MQKQIFLKLALTLVFLSQMVIAQASSDPAVEYLSSEATIKANLPFSEAVRVGNMLYLSGQIGIDPATGKLVAGGVASESKQIMENIKATLEKFGSSMDEVVKCTVFIDDISQWQELNKVYVSYFKKNLPARSALGADGLALGSAVEIECFASIKAK